MIIAQQLIDASKDGGAAFIAFSIWCSCSRARSSTWTACGRSARRNKYARQRVDEGTVAALTAAAIVSSMSAPVCARLGNSVS